MSLKLYAKSARHTWGRLKKIKSRMIIESKYLALNLLRPTSFRAQSELQSELVTSLYREILFRNPDSEGATSYIKQLTRGLKSLDQLRETLHNSQEHKMLIEPLVSEINTTYDQFLFRAPTHEETRQHVDRFRNRFDTFEKMTQAIRSGNIRTYLGIRPLNLEMDITNQCNLRCTMCYFADPAIYKRKREDISVEDFASIAKQIFPLAQRVCLSFATEPLIHRKFGELAAIVKKYEVPKVYINTNALLMNENLIEQMIDANFFSIGISMDGATRETYERIRVGSKFEKVIANIQAINRAKQRFGATMPHITLSFVMMRSNMAELPAFIRLAHELEAIGVNAVHMVHYNNLDNEHESLERDKALCNRMLDQAQTLADQYRIQFHGPEKFVEPPALAQPAPTAETPVLIPLTPLTETPARAGRAAVKTSPNRFDLNLMTPGEAETYCCPFPWHFVGIDASGGVVPCGWWYNEEPMGNIKTQSFLEIWHNERYQTLRTQLRTGALRTTCRTCPAAGMGRVNDQNAFLTYKGN